MPSHEHGNRATPLCGTQLPPRPHPRRWGQLNPPQWGQVELTYSPSAQSGKQSPDRLRLQPSILLVASEGPCRQTHWLGQAKFTVSMLGCCERSDYDFRILWLFRPGDQSLGFGFVVGECGNVAQLPELGLENVFVGQDRFVLRDQSG